MANLWQFYGDLAIFQIEQNLTFRISLEEEEEEEDLPIVQENEWIGHLEEKAWFFSQRFSEVWEVI